MTNEELVKKIQEGENVRENLEALYLQNIGMINRIVARYAGIEDPEDLRQEAFFGLERAARTWERGLFINYAVFFIRSAIVEYCSGNSSVYIPRKMWRKVRLYQEIIKRYRRELGRDPLESEICEEMELSPQCLQTVREAVNASRHTSITAPIGGEEGDPLTLEELLADPAEPFEEVLDRIQREELARDLWSCVDCLDGLQRDVIRDKYRHDHTNKECSEALGLPIETVKRSEAQGLRELRKPIHARRLQPYLTLSGAYSLGLRGTCIHVFNRFGSVQERAMMKLEKITGKNLYGVKINAES